MSYKNLNEVLSKEICPHTLSKYIRVKWFVHGVLTKPYHLSPFHGFHYNISYKKFAYFANLTAKCAFIEFHAPENWGEKELVMGTSWPCHRKRSKLAYNWSTYTLANHTNLFKYLHPHRVIGFPPLPWIRCDFYKPYFPFRVRSAVIINFPFSSHF